VPDTAKTGNATARQQPTYSAAGCAKTARGAQNGGPWLPKPGGRITGRPGQSGLGDVLDKPALSAYRQRLRDLEQELAEAEEWSDLGRLDAVRAERDALLDELARATGLGGRPRTTGSSQERARVAVKKAITAAIDRIATVDGPLARHLRTGSHTGLNCSYEPDPGDGRDWVLEWRPTEK
jgi:hypothetical protein